jgi:pimeloyl-ACP methyl ester carboxylesterase
VDTLVTVEHRFVPVNGIRMHVAERGDGPLVLLLHGFPESWYSWRHQIEPLAAAGFRVVVPDQRGYGRTDCPEPVDQFSIMHLVGDVTALIGALGEKRAIVIGHDWGAPVAWATALMRPDLVAGVAGLSVPPSSPLLPLRRPATSPISAYRERFGDDFYMVVFQEPGVGEAFLGGDLNASFRGIMAAADANAEGRPASLDGENRTGNQAPPLPRWLSEDDLEVFVAEYAERGFAGGLNWYRNIDRNWELLAPWDGAVITPPSLYIIGDRDNVRGFIPVPESLGALREHLPQARALVTVPDCGHWTQQEQPAAVNEALVEFARSIAT